MNSKVLHFTFYVFSCLKCQCTCWTSRYTPARHLSDVVLQLNAKVVLQIGLLAEGAFANQSLRSKKLETASYQNPAFLLTV